MMHIILILPNKRGLSVCPNEGVRGGAFIGAGNGGDQGACEWGRGGAWLCLLLRTPPKALSEKGCPKCRGGGPD